MLDNQTITILLSLPHIEVSETIIEKSKITIKCESKFGESICPNCLQKSTKVKQKTIKTVRDLPILGKEVYLELSVHQFICDNCKRQFSEKFEFVEDSSALTKRMGKYLYEYIKKETLEHVSGRENIHWNILQNIFSKYAKIEIAAIQKKVVRKIGIDEFALKKGKNDYAVVLVDLETGLVIDVLAERKKTALIEYFKEKGKEYCQQIEVFSCDMWEGFSNTAKELFPNADVVIDRFHFFHNLNQVLDKARKKLRKERADDENIKHIKWLLYKRWDSLNDEQKKQLSKAFEHSKDLKNMYFLKNDLALIFDSHISKTAALTACENWLEKAKILNNIYLNNFIKTFTTWQNDVLNFFTHRVSNGIVEGINNVIKMIKRQAFGFRNFHNFRAKIMVYFY